MQRLRIHALVVTALLALSSTCLSQSSTAGKAIVGYVFPKQTLLAPDQIDAHSLTRINYAFIKITDGRIAPASAVDAQNLAFLIGLKMQNPALTVLVSVGGWLGSDGFSDMALTPQSRKIFVDSAMDFLERNKLDGLDIDWEYPGAPGAGHTFRSEEKQNFTLLLKDLRERFTQAEKTKGRHLYLTIAAGASNDYLSHTEMAEVQRYVDSVNLMSYDYVMIPSNAATGHNAPLFTNPSAPIQGSADASVRAFEQAGVPASKLILGVPFYGRAWQGVAAVNHGLFQPANPATLSFLPYSVIAQNMLGHGFTRYWDSAASAPYLYSSVKNVFVSYDDPESLSLKSKYVTEHGLGGVMFWEYSNDPSGELLHTIFHALSEPNRDVKTSQPPKPQP